jgi:predicted RND superfamily exporter protein
VRAWLERGLAAWGRLAHRFALPVIAGVALMVGALASRLPSLELDTSIEGFLPEDDPIRVRYDAFREQFGRDERVTIALEPPEIFDLGFLATLRSLHRDLEDEVPKLQEVQSLINARVTRGEGDALVVGELFEDWPETPEQLAAVRAIALANPLYRDALLSSDGRLTTIVIETEAYSSLDEVDDAALSEGFEAPAAGRGARRFLSGEENAEIVAAIERVLARYQSPGLRILVAGSPVMADRFAAALTRDIALFAALSLAAIAALLALLFRSLAGVALPLVISALSVVGALGAMAAAGIPLSLPTQILPSFLLAVGVGSSVHVLVIFDQARARGESRCDAIAFSLGHSGLAIIMTSLTTIAGVASFATAGLQPVADLGIAAPFGVLLSLVFTIVLLPALIAVFPMAEGGAAENALDRSVRRLLVSCGELATRRAGAVVAASAALVALSLAGVSLLRFGHDPLRWFPEGNYFRVSSETINREMRGAMFLEVLVDSGRENGLHEPELLNRLEEMRRFSARLEVGDVMVGKTVSVADVVKEIHQALNENRPDFYAVPQDRRVVAQELLLFENSGSDDLEDLVDPRFRTARFTLKIPYVDAVQYPPFYDAVERGFGRILEDRAEITITGLMAIVGRTFNAVMQSLALSYVVAFALITPLMVLLIGNLRIGLLSMVPNLFPIIVTLGVMGWFGIPINAFTLLIGSIAIGLAVDDTIHFLHHFRRHHDATGDVPLSVRKTLTSTGEAMLFTSLVLAAGFFVYMFASMRNLFDFGLLTGFAIGVAFLADVLLSPALLALAFRHRSPSAARAPSLEGI